MGQAADAPWVLTWLMVQPFDGAADAQPSEKGQTPVWSSGLRAGPA